MFFLHQDVWNTVLGNMERVQLMRQNFVASTMANSYCCCDFIYCLGEVGMHRHCNFLGLEYISDCSWLTSMLISSLSQLSLPCAKRLCHLNTTQWPKAFSPYTCLIIWNVSLADLPNFLRNLVFTYCSNCKILGFHCLQTLSEYTARTQLLLAGIREERT
jgi:hypothetical protein